MDSRIDIRTGLKEYVISDWDASNHDTSVSQRRSDRHTKSRSRKRPRRTSENRTDTITRERVRRDSTRRPAGRSGRRRSPLPFIILVLLLLCACSSACWYGNSRTGRGADKAFDRLIAENTAEQSYYKELAYYEALYDKRVKDYIREDHNLVAEDSTAMNKTLDKIATLEKKKQEQDRIKAANFNAATKWFFGWSAKHRAVVEIKEILPNIDKTESGCLEVRVQMNKLLKETNILYIKYANDEISGNEFTEQKKAMDVQAGSLQTKYLAMSQRLVQEKAAIFSKVGVIGE